MTLQTDKVEIEAVLQQLRKAHAERDAEAIVEVYAQEAVIFDLAPPLGYRGMNRDSIASWMAGWDGPIQIDSQDVILTVEGDVAFVTAMNRMRGRKSGENQDVWYRSTICLRKLDGRWYIVHDHSSVPFYMDGSYRAAVDLQP